MKDKITGVDRYPYSLTKGKKVLKSINLFAAPTSKIKNTSIKHGTEVLVLDEFYDDSNKRTWYKVQGVKQSVKEGWVLEAFLEDKGCKYFESMLLL